MNVKQRAKALITSKHLVSGMAVASFAESTVVPVPLEAVLLPAMQANRDRLWVLAGAALAGCVVGAFVGYAIGYFLFDALGHQLVQWFGDQQMYEEAKARVREHGFWFVLSVGVVPIPFQIAMLAAGVVQYSLLGYALATLIARGIRYYGLAVLVWKFGDGAEALVRRHRKTSMVLVTVVVAAAWGVGYLLS